MTSWAAVLLQPGDRVRADHGSVDVAPVLARITRAGTVVEVGVHLALVHWDGQPDPTALPDVPPYALYPRLLLELLPANDPLSLSSVSTPERTTP